MTSLTFLGLLLVIALDITVVADQCQNARAKTVCYEAVMYAMLHGFARNPKEFIGLSIKSTFSDFQGYFYNNEMHECPRPCLEQEQPCKKFGPGYPGMGDVNWAKQVGIPQHPEWYPDIPYPAADKQIAQVLYMHGVETCPRPCEDDEEEGHFVPISSEPVYADSEGWLTSTTVTITATTVTTTTASTTASATTATQTTVTIPPPASQNPTTTETKSLPATAPTTTKLPVATQPATTQTSVAQATTTVLVAEPVTTAPATTSAAAAHDENCFKSGTSLSLLDAAGYTPVSADSSQKCQRHCKSAKSDAEIGFFLWYEPLKICHCPPSEAIKLAVGSEFVSGPLTCDVLLMDASAEVSIPSLGVSGVAVVAVLGVVAAAAVMGSAAMALRRRRPRDAEVLMLVDEESGGLEFTRTWPELDSALE